MKCPYYEELHHIRFVDMEEKDTFVPVCNGRLERDQCNCGGDRCKCDFYPEIREKACKERSLKELKIVYETLGVLIKELIEREENKK